MKDATGGAPSDWVAVVLLALGQTFFAGAIVVGRLVHVDMPPVGLMFWRAVVAFLVLMPFIVGRWRREWPLLRAHWKIVLGLGLTQAALGQVPVFLGLHTTTAVNAGLITATQPALIMLLAVVWLRERIGPRQAVGLIAAFAGTIAIVVRGDIAALARLEFSIGDLWVQIGIASWAAYAILVRSMPRTVSPLVIFQSMTLSSAAVLIPLYAVEVWVFDAHLRFDAATVFTVLYFAVLASVLALWFLAVGIRVLGPSRSGMFNYLMPVITVALAAAILGETLERFHLVGFAFITGGVVLATRKPA
ncbi:MAG: DMT family transporter [Alphaproteobacteria bacterium]|nr:DMT family transporter [Alphaproteobacteria bacterium]